MAGDARRNNIVRGDAVALVENIQVFLGTEGDLQRLAQLALLFAIATHHRVAHIETVIINARFHIR